jgi:flotillin
MKNGKLVRETEGWRVGKPVEDPEKMKRWGFVTAKPSEFLVHVRRGRVMAKTSGQGATCFKWPNDAVAIVPTSLQRLQFTADQVTLEKVGVEVVGLAVYRIADPLLAYRVLNFSYPERAQEKLEETLTSMFVGATRRLVANLPVEDCLQKRKSALAEELLREIAPVVAGNGRPEDTADGGWGVVIDTIEIQEVRVLSEKVFAAMQAPYRTALDKRAREAKALADKDVAEREAECARRIAEAKMQSEAAIALQRAENARKESESQTALSVRRTELQAVEAEAAVSAFERKAAAMEKAAELARREVEQRAEVRRIEMEIALAEGRARAAVEMELALSAQKKADADARLIVAQKLPELAEVMGKKIGEVRITQLDGDGNPFAHLAQSVTAVLDLARKA